MIPCNPGLQPGGREPSEGYGGEVPHLAHPTDEVDGWGAAAGRNSMDHDYLMMGVKIVG